MRRVGQLGGRLILLAEEGGSTLADIGEGVYIYTLHYRHHQVISLNVKWMILQAHRTLASFLFLSIFHLLLAMTLWSLYEIVHRGPGMVGETLVGGTLGQDGDLGERDLEAGNPSTALTDGRVGATATATATAAEAEPLMGEGGGTVDVRTTTTARRKGRTAHQQHTSDKPYTSGTSSEDEEAHASQASGSDLRGRMGTGAVSRTIRRSRSRSSDSDDSSNRDDSDRDDFINDEDSSDDDDDNDGDEDEEAPNKRSGAGRYPVEIIYPNAQSSSGTLMAKANGRARFCRKVRVTYWGMGS